MILTADNPLGIAWCPVCRCDTLPHDRFGQCLFCDKVIVADGKALYHPADILPALTPGVRLCECGCGDPAPLAKWNSLRKGHIKGEPVRFISGHNRRVTA